ncbi:MAG: hypothetical protein ABI208_05325 [Ginsengibacter sp.]|jgi:hypothetical protein
MNSILKKIMMKNSLNKIIPSLLFLSVGALPALAQNDTLKKPVIEVTSSYKPALRNSVKINLYPSAIPADTSTPKLTYKIPAQNLFFAYQPVITKPLSLEVDTSVILGGRNQIKLGFGNLSTPYAAAAFSIGDGKKGILNLYGDYISSKGKINFQDYSEVSLKSKGSLFTNGHEIYAGIGFYQHQYFNYGYDPASMILYNKDMLRKKYQDFSLDAGFRNAELNEAGINYNPHVSFNSFNRENATNENTISFELPAEKKLNENITVKVSASGNFTNFEINSSSVKFNNHLFQIAPEVVYSGTGFTVHGGATPSWNNGELSILPNLYAEVQLPQNIFTIQAGWVGRYIANSFRTLSEQNPFINDPNYFTNTKEISYYGGIKASAGQHLSFNAKAAYINYHGFPLFVNDNISGKGFNLGTESKMNNFQIHGDMNYINQDQFSVTAGVDFNAYTGLQNYAQAWGLYPLVINGSFRWNALQQVILKADLISFSGGKALNRSNIEKDMKGGTDLSIGSEFKINSVFSAWLDFNNVLNSNYERWNNYPVYGFQVIGGLIFHF